VTPSETEPHVLWLLSRSGLAVPRPDPLQVWKVFKRFAAEPVECDADYLLFQTGDPDRADTYFDFCREFKLRHGEDEAIVWYEQIHFEFAARRPHRLGFAPVDRWSFHFQSVGDFFAAVEQSPEFRAGLSFPHWDFRVYHTGI
jgi:hypothetical protein